MQISILSRSEMKKMLAEYQHDEKSLLRTYKVISIFSNEGPVFSEISTNLLCLDFDDVELGDYAGAYKLFDKEQASQVINFLMNLDSQDELIVHCAAGISRSGAVGTFAAELSGQSVEALHKRHPRVHPNSWVLDLLQKSYEEQLRINNAALSQVQETQNTGSLEISGLSDDVNVVEDLSEKILSLSLANLDMDNRTKNILMRNKVRTIGQVRSMKENELRKLKGMGEVTMQSLKKFLDNLGALARTMESQPNELSVKSSQDKQSILLEIFLKWWEEQKDSGRAIQIMMGRWGGFGRKQTLEEIGGKQNLTRERVRQLSLKYEKRLRNRCGVLMRAKIQALFQDRKAPLYLECIGEEDLWFSKFETLKSDGIADPFLFMGHMIESILGDYFVCDLDDRKILCRIKNKAIDEFHFEINKQLQDLAAQGVTLRNTVNFVRERCGDAKVPELQTSIMDLLREGLNFGCDNRDNDVFLKSVGTNVVQTVIAVLQTAEKPLHFNDVTERCRVQYGKDFEVRRVASVLQNIALLYNRGTYGLKKHFHLSEGEENCIREELENIIQKGSEERQWHCDELLALLRRKKPEFAELCDQYTVNILLQESPLVRDLRRFVWVDANSNMFAASDRKQIGECSIEILRKAGRPMSNDELTAALANERGIKRGMQIHPNHNLIRVDRGTWGLLERDFPLSATQRNEMCDELFFCLEKQGNPIHISQAMEHIVHANVLNPSLVMSLAQIDSRFRVDRAKNIHLSKWDTSGVSSISNATANMEHYGAA